MNPRERLLGAMRGEKTDRVPLSMYGFNPRSRDQIEKIADPLNRKITERIMDEMIFRIDTPTGTNRFLVTPPQRIKSEHKNLPNGNRRTFGTIDTPLGELTFVNEFDPQVGTSWGVKYPVETEEDIKKIASVPWELPPNLAPIKSDVLPDDLTERGVLSTATSSPFVCVAGLMEYELFLEWCGMDLDLMIELTEICRQRILDCLSVVLSKPGIEYVWIGGSEWVTPPMTSPMTYDALVQEQERSLIQYIHENSNAVVHVHCHGYVRHAIQRTIERGAEFTEPVEPPPDGDITMAEAKELAAGRITLGGNVETRVLYNESEDATEEAVRAAFEGGKERFVLGTSAGPSPRMTEQEFKNYMRLIDVWEELSPIEAN